MKRLLAITGTVSLIAASLVGCATEDSGSGADSLTSTGPITIWYSNNEQEVAWGEEVVAAWNAEHPDEQVSAEEIPAGKSSEEVIGAAIVAGNAPCLVYNTAPAAVADFQEQGGLVNLSDFADGASYIESRTGEAAEQFRSPEGYFQMPWKSNPVVLFYNKDVFAAAGLDPEDPEIATYDDLLEASRAIVSSGAAQYALYPAPSSEFYQAWFDFYSLFAAESDGSQLLEDGEPAFLGEDGLAVAELWRTMYAEGLAGQEPYTGDAFTDGVSAMTLAGPWAVPTYEGKVSWGTAPVPTSAGTTPEATATFDDSKNVGLFSACENQATAWEFLKFSTSAEQDGLLLETTGQIPMRADLGETAAEFFAQNPQYASWSTGRTVAVPNTLNSTEIWQIFRDAWTSSVIFGERDIDEALTEAADDITALTVD